MHSEVQRLVFEIRCFDSVLSNCIIPYNSKNNFVMSWECLGQLPLPWWPVCKGGVVEQFLFALCPALSPGYGKPSKGRVGLVWLLLTFHERMRNFSLFPHMAS